MHFSNGRWWRSAAEREATMGARRVPASEPDRPAPAEPPAQRIQQSLIATETI